MRVSIVKESEPNSRMHIHCCWEIDRSNTLIWYLTSKWVWSRECQVFLVQFRTSYTSDAILDICADIAAQKKKEEICRTDIKDRLLLFPTYFCVSVRKRIHGLDDWCKERMESKLKLRQQISARGKWYISFDVGIDVRCDRSWKKWLFLYSQFHKFCIRGKSLKHSGYKQYKF